MTAARTIHRYESLRGRPSESSRAEILSDTLGLHPEMSDTQFDMDLRIALLKDSLLDRLLKDH